MNIKLILVAVFFLVVNLHGIHLQNVPAASDNSTVLVGNLTDGNGYTCLRYEMTVHLSVKYNTTDNKTSVAHLLLPQNTTLLDDGNKCADKAQEKFTLSAWNSANLTMWFNSSENSVFLSSIILSVNHTEALFPKSQNQSQVVVYTLNSLNPNLNVDKSHSYVCSNNVTIPKNDDKSDVHAIFSSLRIQAFMQHSQNGTFSEEHNCQNEINDVVPIAVGAALTGLVIIVLIAYFIGRKRSRRTAYQSV